MTADGHTTSRATQWPSIVAVVLTVAALLTLYVCATSLLGSGDRPYALAWQNAVVLAIVALAARPTWRWLDESVHDLATQHHEPYGAIRAISSPGAPSATLASAIARAANLDWVEVELDGTSSAGVRRPGTATVDIPIEYDGQTLGVIRTTERRQGRGITHADREVLRELANQMALRVVAERATARVAESRNQIVTAREEERMRIRRDLHDGLAPSLASISFQLKALQRGLDEHDALRGVVDGLLADVTHTSRDLRRLVYGLRPPLLDALGIAGALEHQFADPGGPQLRIHVDASDLPAAVEVALLRIATEAVHNAVKHAGAGGIEVIISRHGDVVRLTVTDDGVGMPRDVVPGIGLSAMMERAEELGGSVTVGSGPGGGTVLVAELRVMP